MATPGKEGQTIAAGAWAGNVIGVFTSGGDSQGLSMNPVYHSMIMRMIDQNPLHKHHIVLDAATAYT